MRDMDIEGAQHLWRKVLLQAVRDALTDEEVKDDETRQARRDARAWLDAHGKDFIHVCTLAGFDPAVVRDWWMVAKNSQQNIHAAAETIRAAHSANFKRRAGEYV